MKKIDYIACHVPYFSFSRSIQVEGDRGRTGFPVGGLANHRGSHQHTNLSNFPKAVGY